MTLPTGLAPRDPAAHLERARWMLAQPPGATVALPPGDDGWWAVGAKIAGLIPTLAPDGDPARVEGVLRRLGLGGLGEGLPDAPDGPLVTVLICTYNRRALLREAIDSARAQRWPVEVLVVDDGSTDGTWQDLEGMEGIRALRQEPNQGKPAALNRGIAEARGAFILVLDDDDRLLPGSVAVLARALDAQPDAAAVLADSVHFSGATGQALGVTHALRLPSGRMGAAILSQIPALPGATLVRASAQRAAGAFDLRLNMLEDMDMFLRLAEVGPLHTLPVPVQLYRQHDGARGGAADRVEKRDAVAFQSTRTARARPVFRERWAARSPIPDRESGFGWALGLKLRGLHPEALEEARRWDPPYSMAEARIRRRVGLPAQPAPPRGSLVVIHDGDSGALAETLDRHAAGAEVHIRALRPVEGAGNVDLLWPATLRPAEGLAELRSTLGPWRFCRTAAPGWCSPPVRDFALVPALAGAGADLLAVEAMGLALGWPEAGPTRATVEVSGHPLLEALRAARAHVEAGERRAALAAFAAVAQAIPGWTAPLLWARQLQG